MRLKFFAIFILLSGTLHFLWESFHIRLYGGYEHLSPYLPTTLWATFADIAYVIGAIVFVSLLKGNVRWLFRPQWNEYAGLAIAGFCIAVFVEYKAFVFGKWYYLDTMPIIPWLDIGVSPILQMVILLPFGVFLANRIMSRLYTTQP